MRSFRPSSRRPYFVSMALRKILICNTITKKYKSLEVLKYQPWLNRKGRTMTEQDKSRVNSARFLEGIENMVDEAVGAATESIKETMKRVRAARDSVVKVRLTNESLP